MASGIVMGRVSVKSVGMKRSTRSFVDKVLRSGKRLFADRYEEEMKRVRLISVAFLDAQVNKVKVVDHCTEINNNFKLGEPKSNNVNGTVTGTELGKSSSVADNPTRIKQFRYVYTRKRKRGLETNAKVVIPKKVRSGIKRIPRVSVFNNYGSASVESVVPVPGVKEVVGYGEGDYVPFMLPESYIIGRSDEVSRILEQSCTVYDMDSDDEQWLKKLDNVRVSEDVFERVIDAFERGMYCSPRDYCDAASAVDRCLELASKDVLEDVYRYWIAKRRKRRSALVRVFQCYKQKRVKRSLTSAVIRKKRSFRRRASQRFAEKQLDFKQAILNNEILLEKSTKACIKVHETQEAAKRLEEASIVKRQQAQALMEAADLAVYRAAMALKIAEALAAGGSVEPLTGATFGPPVE